MTARRSVHISTTERVARVVVGVVTGATGHRPLYKKLGHVPASLRGRRTS